MHEVSDRDAGQGLLGVGVELGLAHPVWVEHEPQPGDRLLELRDGVGPCQRQEQVEGFGGEPVALRGGVVLDRGADAQGELADLVVAERTGQPRVAQPRVAVVGGVA